MSNPKKVTGMEHFSRLNSSVFYHEPISQGTVSPGPNLILLAGWMGASIRNIAKYTAEYENLYPTARIVVITTTAIDAALSTHFANDKRIAPVLEILYALPPDAKFLFHLFSNGGSYTSTLIARKYQARIGRPLPVTALILDSAPGKATYGVTVSAFVISLPKNILLRLIGGFLVRLFWFGYMLAYWLSRQLDLVARIRVDLNKKSILDLDTPRLYIYSIADAIVPWQFVEEHAEEAEKLGYTVYKEKFQESVHCGHLMMDPDRYWSVVDRLWKAVS